jgi:basic amino acid/polyamine antiporter, APA family
MADLKRQLGLLDATMINVGTIIASAIFLVPSVIAQQVHATIPTILVWVVGGVVSLLGALSVAELGAALPGSGGGTVYLARAYGPVWGYLYGWANGTVINPASIAAIAVGFAGYLGVFVPLTAGGIKLVAIGSIAALTLLNCLGVRAGARTQNALTLIKIATVAALALIAFGLPGGSTANFRPLWPSQPATSLIGPFGVAMVAVLWAYDGWIEITYVAGEVRDPGRIMPRAIILSTVIAIGLYTAVTAAYAYVLSPSRMAASTFVASDAARVPLGAVGAQLVAAAIVISTLGANNGIVLTSARIPYALARDGLLPGWLGGVDPRFFTPVPSLLAQGAIAVTLTFTGTYDQLFTYVIFTEFLFYALICGAVIRLRHAEPGLVRPYRTWGYPVTPVLFIAFAAWLVGNTVAERLRDAGVGMGIVLSGLPVYWWMVRRRPGA